MKNILMLFVLFFLNTTIFGAAFPVIKELNTNSKEYDSLDVRLKLLKSFPLIETKKNDTLFYRIVDDLLKQAKDKKEKQEIGTVLMKLGNQLRYEVKYKEAIWLYKKALEIGEETKDNRLIILSNNNLGVVFRRIDDYPKAMKYHMRALQLAIKVHDSVSRAMAINSIGNIYLMLGDYNKALQYFKQSLRLEQSRNNPIGIAINLNNIAQVYEKKGYLKKALTYYKLSLEINRNLHSIRGRAICNNDIAGLLKKHGRYREALKYSKRALLLAQKMHDYNNLASAYIQTGALFSALKNYDSAYAYLNPGLALAHKIRAVAVLEEGYHILSQVYMDKKEYPLAIKYLKLKQAYHDSLINLAVKKEIARLQIEFDSQNRRNQLQFQKQKTKIAVLQLKKQQYLLYSVIGALILILFVLGFVVYYLITKSRQNRVLQEKNKKIKAAEKRLTKSNKALQQALKKVEENAKAQSDFLTNISHEIRTPLNSVIGFAEILCATVTDETQKTYLQTIKSSGESLLALINDILDLSKIENDKIELVFKEINIRHVMGDILNIFSLEASNKGIQLLSETDESVPEVLLFDESRLRQILLNLVGNAIKFTDEGQVIIHTYATPLQGKEEIELHIEVTDTGTGISKEEQEMIFLPFRQGNTKQKTSGTGLGLSITRRMTEAMNGEIKLDSTPGKGSRFTLLFHQVKVMSGIENSMPTLSFTENKKLKKCLFISEPHALRNSLLQMFESHGFQVENTGIDLALAKRKMKRFRLIVFCCLNKETLENTRNIFERENLDQEHVYLILNKVSGFQIEENKAASISLFNRTEQEIKQDIRNFIGQFEENETARLLFSIDKRLQNENRFHEQLAEIYRQYFLPAYESKMMDKIELFSQQIKIFSELYHLSSLLLFAQEMEEHLKKFDIVFIEKQMHIFQKAYRKAQDES